VHKSEAITECSLGCDRLVIERDREALAVVEATEWEQRRLEIERQAEEARREKKRRRAEAEVTLRSQVIPPLIWQPMSASVIPCMMLCACSRALCVIPCVRAHCQEERL
jgi:hypothetical protein